MNYTDADLTFCLQVFRDAPLARWSLSHLRGLYRNSRVIVISDGDFTIDPNTFADFNVDFRQGEELFLIERGGAMFERNFSIYLENPTKWFFKIDSDVGWHRRFLKLPEDTGIFGTVQRNGSGLRSLQGGCYGMDLDTVTTIINSNILKDNILKNPEETYALTEITRGHCNRTGKISEDWMMGWIATELGISMFDYTEIHSKWLEYVDNSEGWFSVTHPCKDFHL